MIRTVLSAASRATAPSTPEPGSRVIPEEQRVLDDRPVAEPVTVKVWWIVDHTSDIRHATIRDPAPLPDREPVMCLCGREIAHAAQETRPAPRPCGTETFHGQCVTAWAAATYGAYTLWYFHY